ncbi:MAG: dephospho-CoA kinase [Marinicella sp.]
MPKLKVCLTGGIASGKTFVSNRMALLGAQVIDADILAREVVRKGSVGLGQLINAFGVQILDGKGQLNRSMLKSLAFTDKKKLAELNGILHPLIWQAFSEHSAKNDDGVEIWVIPLFNSSTNKIHFDRVLVVDVTLENQISRMQRRDGVNLQLAESILAAQPSRLDRVDLATDVITNNGGLDLLQQNADHIYGLYKALNIH